MESRILFSLSAVPLGACETLKGGPHWTGHSLLAFALFRANLAAFCFAIIDLICSNRAVSASLNFCSASARCLNRASALAGSLIYQLLSCYQIHYAILQNPPAQQRTNYQSGPCSVTDPTLFISLAPSMTSRTGVHVIWLRPRTTPAIRSPVTSCISHPHVPASHPHVPASFQLRTSHTTHNGVHVLSRLYPRVHQGSQCIPASPRRRLWRPCPPPASPPSPK